jgi:hypothetical protein
MNNEVNIVQLKNAIAIIVDDDEFKKVKRKFKSIFYFSRFLTIIDVRQRKIIIRKRDIILLEGDA